MTFKVSKFKGPVVYDSMPVATIISYPLEKRDYRPYAQNVLCVSDDMLYLRMWAFEVSPSFASRLECVIYLFKDAPDTALSIVAAPQGEFVSDKIGFCLIKDGRELPVSEAVRKKLQGVSVHPYNGEDLQGVYWGYSIGMPIKLLEEWGGGTLLNAGDNFLGNFFKLCDEEPFAHMGCFFEADFTGNPYLKGSMGEFEVVSY